MVFENLDINAIMTLMQNCSYLFLLIIMIFEGPIITFVSAFAASLGIFNIYIVFLLSFLGDIIGDLMYYSIGRAGRNIFIDKMLNKFGVKNKRIRILEKKLHRNLGKTITLIKIVPPLPTPGLILAGSARVHLWKFILWSSLISFFYALFFTLIGYYFGYTYAEFSRYLKIGEILLPIFVLLTIVIWILMKRFSKNISRKMKQKLY